MPPPLPPNVPPTIPYVFNYPTWVMAFPEFRGVSVPAAELYFTMATVYVKNGCRTPINSPKLLALVLNLTTAHLAKIFSLQTDGQPTTNGTEPPSGLVGRISNATEGSVSVTAEMEEQSASAAWWNQTIYGAAAYKALNVTRTMRYLPGPRRRYNPPVRGGGFFGGGLGGL